jgi:hypothetical protein
MDHNCWITNGYQYTNRDFVGELTDRFVYSYNNSYLYYLLTASLITPNSFPTFSNAAIALSKCSLVCAADS